ncbi:MAG: protein translocase SEC61 complex subunit gamma [Candidatus Diapherotrites archaeon]
MFDVSGFIDSTKRILTVSKKPDRKEYATMVKITGLGILLIAVVGFVVMLIFRLLNLGI